MLLAMFVLFFFWLYSSSKSAEIAYAEAREIKKDYKSVFDGYKKAWDFDKLEFKKKASVEWSFTSFYNSQKIEDGYSKVNLLALVVLFISCVIWSIITWGIIPVVLKPILPGINGDWLSFADFVVPVVFWGYLFFLHSKLFPDRKSKYKTGYGNGMAKDLYRLDEAITAMQNLPENSEFSREAERLRAEDAASSNGTGAAVIKDGVPQRLKKPN